MGNQGQPSRERFLELLASVRSADGSLERTVQERIGNLREKLAKSPELVKSMVLAWEALSSDWHQAFYRIKAEVELALWQHPADNISHTQPTAQGNDDDDGFVLPPGVDPADIPMGADTPPHGMGRFWFRAGVGACFVLLLIILPLVPFLRPYSGVWQLVIAVVYLTFGITIIVRACIFAFAPLVKYIKIAIHSFEQIRIGEQMVIHWSERYQQPAKKLRDARALERLAPAVNDLSAEAGEEVEKTKSTREKLEELNRCEADLLIAVIELDKLQIEVASNHLVNLLGTERVKLFSRALAVFFAAIFVVVGFGLVFYGLATLATYLNWDLVLGEGSGGNASIGRILYFSLFTFTTVGVEGIHASHWSSQVVASIETVVGLAFLVVIVVVSVSLLTNENPVELARNGRRSLQRTRDYGRLNRSLNETQEKFRELRQREAELRDQVG